MLKTYLSLFIFLTAVRLPAQDCLSLPENYTGFSRVDYISEPDGAGDRLVVGAMNNVTISAMQHLPLPTTENQLICGSVTLGPGVSVTAYVPSASERTGDFSTFGAALLDPATLTGGTFPSGMSQFESNIIPPNRQPGTVAWRVASVDAAELTENGVVNGATFAPGIAAGSWVTIYGVNLARSSRIWSGSDFAGNLLPSDLDGVQVTIGGMPASVYFISPRQLNVQAPMLPPGPALVQVSSPFGVTAAASVNVQQYAPGWFTATDGETLYPAAVHSNGDLLGHVGLYGNTVGSRQARPGHVIWLYGTGFGPTDPALPAGQIIQGYANLADPQALEVTIGGVPATVEFAGMTGAGLYQINVTVPDVPPGDQELLARIGGETTQANTMISVVDAGVVSDGRGDLEGTYAFDLDTGYMSPFDRTADLSWSIQTQVDRLLYSAYSATIVNIGVVDFDSITLDDLLGLNYSKETLNGSNNEQNVLTPGDIFAVRTTEGNYAKVLVEEYGYTLKLRWVTYAGPESATP